MTMLLVCVWLLSPTAGAILVFGLESVGEVVLIGLIHGVVLLVWSGADMFVGFAAQDFDADGLEEPREDEPAEEWDAYELLVQKIQVGYDRTWLWATIVQLGAIVAGALLVGWIKPVFLIFYAIMVAYIVSAYVGADWTRVLSWARR